MNTVFISEQCYFVLSSHTFCLWCWVLFGFDDWSTADCLVFWLGAHTLGKLRHCVWGLRTNLPTQSQKSKKLCRSLVLGFRYLFSKVYSWTNTCVSLTDPKIWLTVIVSFFQYTLRGLNVIAEKSMLKTSYVSLHVLFISASNWAPVRTPSTINRFRLLSVIFPKAELLINL